MKSETLRKLKNVILNINFGIMIFLSHLSFFLKIEVLFIFFKITIKTAAQKFRVGRFSGNTAIFHA